MSNDINRGEDLTTLSLFNTELIPSIEKLFSIWKVLPLPWGGLGRGKRINRGLVCQEKSN